MTSPRQLTFLNNDMLSGASRPAIGNGSKTFLPFLRRLPSIKLTGRRDGGGGRQRRVGFKTSRLASAVSSTSMSGARANERSASLRSLPEKDSGAEQEYHVSVMAPLFARDSPRISKRAFRRISEQCVHPDYAGYRVPRILLHVRSVKMVHRDESRCWNEPGFICLICWSREMNLARDRAAG